MHAICSRRHLGVFARGAHIDQPPTTIGGNATSFSNSGQFSGSVISAPQLPLSAQGDGRLALTGQHDRNPVTTKHEKRSISTTLFSAWLISKIGRAHV